MFSLKSCCRYFPNFKSSKKFGFDIGLIAYPVTLAPKLCKSKVNQLPLNPVCPVIRTFLFFQKIFFFIRLVINVYFLKIQTVSIFKLFPPNIIISHFRNEFKITLF